MASTAAAAPATTVFTFDGDYGNTAQVQEYYPAYTARYEQIVGAGGYPYDADFEGQIDGLVAATDKDERTAIYLLQRIRHREEEQARVQGYLDAGYVRLEQGTPGVTRYREAVLVHTANKGSHSQFLQFSTLKGPVRVAASPDGALAYVLAKGARRFGHLLDETSANELYVRG